jgi:hypothetical protein
MNQKPLESFPLLESKETTDQQTAAELKLHIISHETTSFQVYEAITRSHQLLSNLLISRANHERSKKIKAEMAPSDPAKSRSQMGFRVARIGYFQEFAANQTLCISGRAWKRLFSNDRIVSSETKGPFFGIDVLRCP